MGLLSFLRGRGKGSKCNRTVENPEVKKRRRLATIRSRGREADKAKLTSYLEQYEVGVTYGGAGGELTGQTIRDLAMALFEAGDNYKTIKNGLPKLPTSPYSTCEEVDEHEYAEVGPPDLTVEEKKTAALGLIEGINKLLKSGIKDNAIHTSILEEFKSLGYTYPEITDLAGTIGSQHKDLMSKLTLFNPEGGGKRARRVRRTKRTKGKSRGRARKATRVRRNNNSNKTKRNKGKKRRTKRA